LPALKREKLLPVAMRIDNNETTRKQRFKVNTFLLTELIELIRPWLAVAEDK
jgi:hypothetical protein